jgi:hypothetical protein
LNLPQDVEQKKAEPKTPHFLSLIQDIVASPQDEKCGLKYDRYNFSILLMTLCTYQIFF